MLNGNGTIKNSFVIVCSLLQENMKNGKFTIVKICKNDELKFGVYKTLAHHFKSENIYYTRKE